MTDKLFKYVGISKSPKFGYKVRFGNDLLRFKLLARTDTDIQLVELPAPSSKSDAIKHLKTTELYNGSLQKTAVDAAFDKNCIVKVASGKRGRPSKYKFDITAEQILKLVEA